MSKTNGRPTLDKELKSSASKDRIKQPNRGNKSAGKPSRGNSKLRTTEEDSTRKISNDPNWYFSDTMLAQQVSNFSFNQFLGVPFNMAEGRMDAMQDVPTIAKFYLAPSAGWTSPAYPQRSGLNTAGFKLYTQLSARNAKTTSYAPQDVTLCILALGSILTQISYLRRLFGLSWAYNVRNRVYVKGLLEIIGVNFDDFMANRADYLAELNYVLTTVNKIPFPASIPYFEKCRTLFDNVYLDSGNPMAQSYVTVPKYVWRFDEAYSEQGSGLRTVVYNSNSSNQIKPFPEYLSILKSCVEALLNSTTLNYVYSDVITMAVKESVPLLHIDLIDTNYSVMPLESPNFMLQLDNATICGDPLATDRTGDGVHFTKYNDVISDASMNCVRYTPCFSSTLPWFGLDTVLNFPTGAPDVASIIESTRLVMRAEAELDPTNSTYYSLDVALPDFFIVWGAIYTSNSATPASNTGMSAGTMANATAWNINAEAFTKMPRKYIFNADSSYWGFTRDTEFFTTVGYKYLARVNDICYQGLFEFRR